MYAQRYHHVTTKRKRLPNYASEVGKKNKLHHRNRKSQKKKQLPVGGESEKRGIVSVVEAL